MKYTELAGNKVVLGLEGSGKSLEVAKVAYENATPTAPWVFSFKTYSLMAEQKETWSKLLGFNNNEIQICGFNTDYEEAMRYYGNKTYPHLVGKKTRLIFLTQSNLQRNKHLNLSYEIDNPDRIDYESDLETWKSTGGDKPEKPKSKVSIGHIVVDEFDVTLGVIPQLDFYYNNPFGDKELDNDNERRFKEFILKNYTKEDLLNSFDAHKEGKLFTKSHWISNSKVPITILTSELLAGNLLFYMGFDKIHWGKSELLDSTIHLQSETGIGKDWFSELNEKAAWNKLGYDLIISDQINEDGSEKLQYVKLNHTTVKGSNKFRKQSDKDITSLTIISHIPKKAIKKILLAYNSMVSEYIKEEFSDEDFSVNKYKLATHKINYDTCEAIFYRDRLTQAVSRTIGYRGSKEAHIVLHEEIYKKIMEVYSIQVWWDLINAAEDEKELLKLEKEFEKDLGYSIMDEKLMVKVSNLFGKLKFIPYTIEERIYDKFVDFAEYVDLEKIEEKRKNRNKELKNKSRERNKKARIETLDSLDLFYELDQSSVITLEEIKLHNEKHNLRNFKTPSTLTASKVLRHFDLKATSVVRNGTTVRAVKGLKLK